GQRRGDDSGFLLAGADGEKAPVPQNRSVELGRVGPGNVHRGGDVVGRRPGGRGAQNLPGTGGGGEMAAAHAGGAGRIAQALLPAQGGSPPRGHARGGGGPPRSLPAGRRQGLPAQSPAGRRGPGRPAEQRGGVPAGFEQAGRGGEALGGGPRGPA